MKLPMALALLAAVGGASSASAQDEPPADPQEAFVPAAVGPDERAIAGGLNRFGFDLFARLRDEPANVAISPASISTAFGLAYAGAKGATAAEIASTLHYPDGLTDFHASFGKLLATMQLDRNGRRLSVNNAIWLQPQLKAQPDYLALVKRHYGAGIQRIDFKADAARARGTINRWVESKTNDRIRNLLSPADVTDKTRSVLVNTVYFKADWATPFDAKATQPGPFMRRSGPPVTLPLMNRLLDVRYAEAAGVKAIALPYRGGETEMVILLPAKPAGLGALEASLDSAAWEGWLARLAADASQDVKVTLPRFKIETRYDLTETMQDMGMRVPLSDASDFSAMKQVDANSRDPEEWNLKIDSIVHQVFVEVEEKGTEAAAATAITQVIVTGARIPREPKVFRADHPFLFVIRDPRTNANLFVGRFTGD